MQEPTEKPLKDSHGPLTSTELTWPPTLMDMELDTTISNEHPDLLVSMTALSVIEKITLLFGDIMYMFLKWVYVTKRAQE